jgi:predicted RNase H-like HicB family nuclease
MGELTMKEYTVVYERASGNWSAYSLDVPGCIATGRTREDVEREFHNAPEFHLEGLQQAGLPLPEPATDMGRIAVSA